ncbi:hypothetical protein AMAG_20044 [Allomyces macrogynus ATCC 38327]|uniref:Uncharacterized protein n=1 Tax=Allomyces macrogynus (strain ATCC 38327) TaxID=578462 RepID=A0A0L0T5D7_ALLM3|nr:hypothetical protein AMAG_20044 [Allomyces macrogynus ATCC 38327]|eukprot:KNE69784.1 hypothetical protein AMAG_20044 [Allomyces macrogynus ATCC 38327]
MYNQRLGAFACEHAPASRQRASRSLRKLGQRRIFATMGWTLGDLAAMKACRDAFSGSRNIMMMAWATCQRNEAVESVCTASVRVPQPMQSLAGALAALQTLPFL